MENKFNKTKEILLVESKDLVRNFATTFDDLFPIWNESFNESGWSCCEILEHVYLVNQHVLSKIKFIQNLLLSGLVNNEIDYSESDLRIVDVMLNVSIYRIEAPEEFVKPLCFSSEEMKFKLINQISTIRKFVQELPLDMASNYKESSKFIGGIKLDIFQLIYLSIIHSKHHFNQIITLKAINDALPKYANNKALV